MMAEEKQAVKIFGTDGVRGRANVSPMTVETALALGRAAGVLLRTKNGSRARVVIGKDTRLSCYMIESALIAGLCSMGIDTLMVGPYPTPAVAFLTRAYRAAAGIVISASHNPYYDNGIKFFSAEGYKLPDEWEREMEALVAKNDFGLWLPADDHIGRNKKIDDADGRYIEFVKGTFPRGKSLKSMKIALDCANGAAYKVAPLIFRELDAEVFVNGNHPNGFNINDACGSLFPDVVQKNVIEHQADVGIALDGDGDRVIMTDENAQIIDGDTILAICARDFQKNGHLRNHTVVSTVMCNFGFIQTMKSLGIKVVQAQVGDRYVIQEMLKHEANLGGEQSGHLICLDYNSTGDGLITALQVLRIMVETDSKLSDLASFVKRYPQALVNVRVKAKPPLEDWKTLNASIDQVEKQLGDAGRVLIRYSGTENICRVMVEGPKQKQVEELARGLAQVISAEIGE